MRKMLCEIDLEKRGGIRGDTLSVFLQRIARRLTQNGRELIAKLGLVRYKAVSDLVSGYRTR